MRSFFGGAIEIELEKFQEEDPENPVIVSQDGYVFAPSGRPWWWAFGSDGAEPWGCGYEHSCPGAIVRLALSIVKDGWPDKIFYPIGEAIRAINPYLQARAHDRRSAFFASWVEAWGVWFDGFGRHG